MVQETAFVAVTYEGAPGALEAKLLLQDILAQQPARPASPLDKPLVLYGAGQLGRMAKEFFSSVGVPVLFVVDADAARHRDDPFWQGTSIVSPGEVPDRYKQDALLAVCIATLPYLPLRDELAGSGWRNVAPFYDLTEPFRAVHPLGNGWFAGVQRPCDGARMEKVLDGWSDDISRAHYLQFIAWRYLRQEWTFEGCPVNGTDRYFIPPVASVLNDHEVLLDLGAYHGNTTLRFLREVGQRFSSMWVVEPDPENLAVLRRNLAPLPRVISDGIRIVQGAVGAGSGKDTFFPGLGYASQISELGPAQVAVQAVDDMGIEASFIKLHLEGGELEALKGAARTIRRHRPIIAVTTYHNHLGLWELPQWLMELVPDYRFYLRLHSWCGTGSVMYCVPCERHPVSQAAHRRHLER